MGISKCGIR
jgi:hypothetical protein